jgi:hypothetical protein
MATPPKPEETGFPILQWEQEELATRPMPLHELPRQANIDRAMAVIGQHHERVAKAIQAIWGTPDCVEYIEKLVLSGGDGFGKARVGFKPEVVSALLNLASLHEVK